MLYRFKIAACAALTATQTVQAIYLNVNDERSVKATAAQIAGDAMRNWYTNANIQGVGQLPRPYYWWEAGAFFGSMVSYWAYTGDTSLNDIVGTAILSQVSPTKDFMIAEQQYDLGNDDQVVWALTAMEAAEHNYPVPASQSANYGSDIWITAAKNAYTDMVKRWDTGTCNGGLRWQIFSQNSGWTYKSAISNAGLFQLAARLARYTGDADGSYTKTANQIYNWMLGVEIIKDYGEQGKLVFDGAQVLDNCTTIDQHRWTYNAASMYLGAEMLSSLSHSNSLVWGPISTDLFHGIQNTFLNNEQYPNVLFELVCEPYGSCNNDQEAFKALALRWINKVTVVSPAQFTNALIKSVTETSAQRAAGQCQGGSSKTLCGMKWISVGWDGTTGAGKQISALEAVQGILVKKATLATAKSAGKRDHPDKLARRGVLTARDFMEMSDAQRLRLRDQI